MERRESDCMKMKVKDARQVYAIVRKLGSQAISSELRRKMIHNTVETKKAQKMMDELVKDLKENMTDAEKDAMEVIGGYEARGERVPTDKMGDLDLVRGFNKILKKEMSELDEKEIEVDYTAISTEERDKLCENNTLTFDELAVLEELK